MGKLRLRYRLVILVTGVFLLLPAPCFSSQSLVAVIEVWPPFRIESPKSPHGFTGIDIDILDGLAKHLGCNIEVQRHPFARGLEMIRAGKADLTTGIAHTEARAEFIRYVPTSYFAVTPVFYTQTGRGDIVSTYNDLYRYKIGYSIYSAYFEPFNSDTGLDKIGISTEEQLIKMVALGRIDLIIGTHPNLAWDIKRYGFKDRVEQVRYIPPKTTPIFFGLTRKKDNTRLQQEIDQYLNQIMTNGELDTIIQAYQ